MVVTCAVFLLLHVTNENAGVLSTVGLFVNGQLFAAAVIRTGRLATAIGLHVGWNLSEGALLGFPVSGDMEGASVVGIDPHGPVLWTGSSLGTEGGLVGILASLAGIGLLLAVTRARPDR